MKTRTLRIIFDLGIFALLAVLVLQAADIRRSLRRIDEERGLIARTRYPVGYAVLETAVNRPRVWYLLQPPMKPGVNDIGWQAPLLQWDFKESFQTSWECWDARRRIVFDACPKLGELGVDTLRARASGVICIAADDPAYSASGHAADVEQQQEQLRCSL